MLELNMFLVS